VADGKVNKQIGAALGISPLTVKNHLARIRARLGAADKAQAVAIALRSGLLD
jgi:DNA-binding CsgD family transcriptional regulator